MKSQNVFQLERFIERNSTEIFGDFYLLESMVQENNNLVIVYMAGYVTRNDSVSSRRKLLNRITFYHQKFREYLGVMFRGRLNMLIDDSCKWSKLCFKIFNAVKDKVRRKSFCDLCMMDSEHYDFKMKKRHMLMQSKYFF